METYLYDVEHNVLVEAVQDTLGHAVVVPGAVHQQQILQVFELFGREGERREERGEETQKAKINKGGPKSWAFITVLRPGSLQC